MAACCAPQLALVPAVRRANPSATRASIAGVARPCSVRALRPQLATHLALRAQRAPARRAVAVKATASLEVLQVASMGQEIAEVATTCFIITLGLAIGFVLLRVEAVVEGDAE